MTKDMEFLKYFFLTEPESLEKQKIKSIRGAGDGLDHLEIITKGKETSWKHKIYTEEV